jgi:hypothetical protein
MVSQASQIPKSSMKRRIDAVSVNVESTKFVGAGPRQRLVRRIVGLLTTGGIT